MDPANARRVSALSSAENEPRLTSVLRLVYGVQAIAWATLTVNNPDPGTRQAAFACILFSAVCLILVQAGRLTFPRIAAPTALLATVAYLLFTGDGVHDIAIIVFPLVILFAALLLGRSGAVGYGILSLAVVAATVIAERRGALEPEAPVTNWGDIMDFGIVFGAVIAVIWIIIGTMRKDLQSALESDARATKSMMLLSERTKELEESRRTIEESEAQYRLLAENVSDVVWVTDIASQKVLYCSPSILVQRGFTPEEFKQLTVETAVKDEYVPLLLEKLAEAREAATDGGSVPSSAHTFSYEVYRKDGSTLWVETAWSFIRDASGIPTQIVTVSRDISERKQSEIEREQSRQQVQSLQQMESLGLLAGGIAHDFNNLLAGIIGNADILRTRLDPSPEAERNLDELITGAQRAADLCKQLLAYAGKGKFLVQPVDLSQLVEEMASLLEVSISKRANLRLILDAELPPVEIDATQIRQIVMNLITNAAEAMDGRHGDISVTTGKRFCDSRYLANFLMHPAASEGQYVLLEVSDGGTGMDEATLTKMWDPFFTLKEHGHGLGLSAVLGIVHGHGGGIKVYSEVGVGTTFKVLLPASENAAERLAPRVPQEHIGRGEGTLLLVDDEPLIREMARDALTDQGYEVLAASNGREALELYQEHRPQVRAVILDLTMPIMGGEETCRELRSLNPKLPVILSSGFNEQETVSRFLRGGLAGFLQKPYRVDELLSVVSQTLSMADEIEA